MGIMDGRYADLQQLARLYNIQTSYYGVDHRRRTASPESLLAVLRALGAPVASLMTCPFALRERRLDLRRQVLEPVNVFTDGQEPPIQVCLPGAFGEAAGECRSGDGGRRGTVLALAGGRHADYLKSRARR